MDYIEHVGNPISTRQLAINLCLSWHTAQQYCLELLLKGKIDRLTIGGSHIWLKKGSYSAKIDAHDNVAPANIPMQESLESRAVQKNQLKEHFLNHFAEKQFSEKIDAAINNLLDKEIEHTFKELQIHIEGDTKNSLEKKEQKEIRKKQEESFHGRKQ